MAEGAKPFNEVFRRRVRDHVAAYAKPSPLLALTSLMSTLLIYGASLVVMSIAASRTASTTSTSRVAWGIAGVVALLVMAGTQVRTFMLHHDLCHGSFTAHRRLNRWLAVVVGALVSTSPSVWRREHNRHHRDSNNLDCEQDGQTAAWTLERYLAAPRWQRVIYWAANRRPILFVLLPPFYFFGFMRVRAGVVENLVFAAYMALLWWAGLLPFFLASTVVASLVGFLLFHAQHTFDGALRRPGDSWDFFDNGMLGSSYLTLPTWPIVGRVLRWFAYAVEYHHIHHLHPKIPGYRLAACHDDEPRFFDVVPRVTLSDALRTTTYSLYDAERGRFVDVADYGPWS